MAARGASSTGRGPGGRGRSAGARSSTGRGPSGSRGFVGTSSGGGPRTKMVTCPRCKGTGKIPAKSAATGTIRPDRVRRAAPVRKAGGR